MVQSGGAPSQKRKMIPVSDLRAMDNDPQEIKDIFAENVFNGGQWLATLSKDALGEYLNALESKKGIDNHVAATVARINGYFTMKAMFEV